MLVKFVSINDSIAKFDVLETEKVVELVVTDFDDGIATVESFVGLSVISFVRLISNLMDSNFESELQNAYQTREKLKGIRSSINGTAIEFDDADSETSLYEDWKARRTEAYKKICSCN